MSTPVSELQAITPSSIIELFELQLSQKIHGATTIYRFHAGVNATGTNGDVVWAGNTYQAFPIEADGFEYSGNGQLPRPKIRVSNILGTITAIILVTPPPALILRRRPPPRLPSPTYLTSAYPRNTTPSPRPSASAMATPSSSPKA